MSNRDPLQVAEKLPEFDPDKWEYFWGSEEKAQELVERGVRACRSDFDVWQSDRRGSLSDCLYRAPKPTQEHSDKIRCQELTMAVVPEFFEALLPKFDTDNYEYTWFTDDPSWNDCEFWGWHKQEWIKDTNAAGYNIHRRPRFRYLSIEPEYVQEGDEKLSTSSDGTRKWIPYDPEKHKNIKNCSFRRRIKS